ncbi:unnamed protein product [Protopolystoma xenopodis]|uniref:Uncharacterized protein n=1 Tax=Protopolystoma xenopodis TaxID=117903 RepID=A0A448WW37_9PLAT|nr:unnamed protein product [Protopolystoma xenopodis]
MSGASAISGRSLASPTTPISQQTSERHIFPNVALQDLAAENADASFRRVNHELDRASGNYLRPLHKLLPLAAVNPKDWFKPSSQKHCMPSSSTSHTEIGQGQAITIILFIRNLV